MPVLIARWLFFAALLVSTGMAFATQPTFEARLREADLIRSGDQQRFAALISDLSSDASHATAQQRHHLQLLSAYRLLLEGRATNSIAVLEELLSKDIDRTLRYRAGALLANNYAIAGRFVDGVSTMERTLAQTASIQDQEARHQVLTTAAILYNQMGQFSQGLRFSQQVLSDKPGPRLRCFAQNLRLESLQRLGRAPERNEFESAIKDCVDQNEQIVAGFGRTYLARHLHDIGQVGAAIRLLESHLPDLRRTQYPRVLADVYALLAQYQYEVREYATASRYAASAIELGAQPLPLSVAHKVLYEIARSNGDLRAALMHFRAYAEAEKAHLAEVNAREMAYQTVRQELAAQSQKITLLNRQNEVLKLQQQVDRQSATNMRMLTGLLLVLAAAIAYWALRVKRMENALRRQTQVDSLTGVASRQHFMREAEGLLRRYKAEGTQVALVMFDLDNFKAVNDRYGHAVGDWVLKRAAEACSASCRRGDLIGRLGGEEFAMLLCDVPAEGAVRAAEACRAAIRRIDSSETGHVFQPGASFGICLASRSGYDLTALLSHADKALYRAKHDGRNCVRMHGEDGLGDCLDAATRPSLRLAHSTGATEA
jgi:diguanylate cyclase (GGDEF)-like protein